MIKTATAIAMALAIGLGGATTAEAGDRHRDGKGYSGWDRDRGHHRADRHQGRSHKTLGHHRYRGHGRGYKRGHRWKRGHGRYRHDYRHGYRDGRRHHRPYGHVYERRTYGTGIGLNIDGVTFIWTERGWR